MHVIAAAPHDRVRHLVHRFKYHADLGAGAELAHMMLPLLRPGWSCLIPVPRALVRRLRYGVDPAAWLATELGRRSGTPVIRALRPGVWWPRHAGSQARVGPRLVLASSPPSDAVLIDDVVTTGATLDVASRRTGVRMALVASRARRVVLAPP